MLLLQPLNLALAVLKRLHEVVDGAETVAVLTTVDGVLKASQDVVVNHDDGNLVETLRLGTLDDFLQTVSTARECRVIDQSLVLEVQLACYRTLTTGRSAGDDGHGVLAGTCCTVEHDRIQLINDRLLCLAIVRHVTAIVADRLEDGAELIGVELVTCRSEIFVDEQLCARLCPFRSVMLEQGRLGSLDGVS